jgi:putative ABC transport system ATP-binding protein
VAIARSLVTGPSLLLADEPTGNLDSHTSNQIMTILQELNSRGLTIVLVTHEADVASYCPRQVRFRDGRVTSDTGRNSTVVTRDQHAPLSLSTPRGIEEGEVKA